MKIRGILTLVIILGFSGTACSGIVDPASQAGLVEDLAERDTETERATPLAAEPAAPICENLQSDPYATFEIWPEVPMPRCLVVLGDQKLRIINHSDQEINLEFGRIAQTVPPGETFSDSISFAAYLYPGVHKVEVSPFGGPELWYVEYLLGD